MSITLAEVADAAGLSISTVSRALSNTDHPMKEETRQRVIALAEEMGYEPNLVARGLRKQETHTVGVIVDRLSSPFAAATLQGIQDTLKQVGYHTSIVNANRESDVALEAIDDFYRRRVDGIVLINSWIHPYNDAFLAPLQRKPFVVVNRVFDAARQHCIVPGDRQGAQTAVRHLADLGHRRIGYINGLADWIEAQNRLAGYQDVVGECDRDADPALVRQGDWGVDSGYETTRALLSLDEPPTAIFAANDLMALGAIYAAQDAGLRVPEDVAIVGYDDRDFAAWVRPALTTIRMPSYEMGESAARLLLNQIEEGDESAIDREVTGTLIVRQSCGARHAV